MDTYRARSGGNGATGAIALVRILSVALGASVNEVREAIPYEGSRGPLAEHPMGIELSVRRCTVSQEEHKGEKRKEGEDKFPRLDVEHGCKVGIF